MALEQLVRIRSDYPHHEHLRGLMVRLMRAYPDGTMLVRVEEGDHMGDVVCLDRRYVELLS